MIIYGIIVDSREIDVFINALVKSLVFNLENVPLHILFTLVIASRS